MKEKWTSGPSAAVAWCRLTASSAHGLSEPSNSVMNSMLTAMRSGISAVGRRMGVSLPQTLRKLLEGKLGLTAWVSVLLASGTATCHHLHTCQCWLMCSLQNEHLLCALLVQSVCTGVQLAQVLMTMHDLFDTLLRMQRELLTQYNNLTVL